ncbi:MAG: hypothetical protein ABIZ04_24830 [Opitutus sp.]
MKNLLRTVCFCAMTWLLACGASAHAAAPLNLGIPAGTIGVPLNLTAREVHDALIKAADGRGWTLVSRDDEMVVVRLEKSDWSARIAMVYSAREVQFFSNSTRKGKPKLPAGWVNYLKEDATRIMAAASVLKN